MESQPGSNSAFHNLIKNRIVSVLLVDDNRVNQFLGKRILQNLGITSIELAGNGVEAFELIKNKSYDIILTDVEMPEMNGYDLSKAIRSHFKGSTLTIIALTANASDEDRERAKEAGVDDYLTKPYTPQDLQEMLQKHLTSKMEIIMEEIIPLAGKVFTHSLENIYTIFHHNKDDVRYFLHMLSGQIPELIQQVKEGLLKDDREQSFQSAHKLKSPVKMLADKVLIAKLTTFAENLREETNLPSLLSQFEEIAPMLESLLVLINKELEILT